jgi:hypothetical protein
MPERYSLLSPCAVAAIKAARLAGPRLIVPPHTDATAIACLAQHGLVRSFMGHAVLTAAGRALRQAA